MKKTAKVLVERAQKEPCDLGSFIGKTGIIILHHYKNLFTWGSELPVGGVFGKSTAGSGPRQTLRHKADHDGTIGPIRLVRTTPSCFIYLVPMGPLSILKFIILLGCPILYLGNEINPPKLINTFTAFKRVYFEPRKIYPWTQSRDTFCLG